MGPGRQEVWARALWVALDSASHAGLDVATLCEGLPFTPERARRLRRVAWDDYVTVVERIQIISGGPDALERLVERSMDNAIPELRSFGRALVSPKTLLRLHWDVFAPLIFPVTEFSYEDGAPDLAHLEARIRPGARPSLAVHVATRAAIRALPRYLGLPDATVTGETAPEHVSWDVRLPPSRSLVSRARRAARDVLPPLRTVLGYDEDGSPVDVAWGGMQSAETRLEVAASRWSVTPHQFKVLRLLVRGKANKEIAEALRSAENTVELHVTNLLRRSGASSRAELIARFWSEPD